MSEIVATYTFSPASRTIVAAEFSGLPVGAVERITNRTTGDVIFDGSLGRSGSMSGTTLTLEYDTNTKGAASSDKLEILYIPDAPTTGTTSSVADNASNATLLSANAARKEAIVQNTSSAVLYVKFGATATASDFTVRLAQYDIISTDYAGQIDGIWASDPNDGAAKITEVI